MNNFPTWVNELIEKGYQAFDISDEKFRHVIIEGNTHVIKEPQWLIMRPGGSTHRVVDANGMTHCYVAPESGKSFVRWKVKSGKNPVAF